MENVHTTISHERLLLNAESFGFGPAVAIASIFPHLRTHFENIGFVGNGHVLDIQKTLTYDRMHDFSDLQGPELERGVRELSHQYDIFFTAMDFPLLEKFKAAGMRCIGYDALAWYWKELPKGVQQSDLYLAQDFFGVRERLIAEQERLPETHVVPPIVPDGLPRKARDTVLINLGGLQNPYTSIDDLALYARKIVTAIRQIIPQGEKVLVATSAGVASKIGEDARTYSRDEMQHILASSKLAFMTPGLGNIYDSAVHNLPTIWLPPANDSQGRQLLLLKENGMCDGDLDWQRLISSGGVNYQEAQTSVLRNISHAVQNLSIKKLEKNMLLQYTRVAACENSATALLLARFGTGGDRIIADYISQIAADMDSSSIGGLHV